MNTYFTKMTTEDYKNYIAYLDEYIKMTAYNPRWQQKYIDEKVKLVMGLPVGFVLKKDWIIERGKIINQDQTMLMHPFDFVLALSSFAKTTDECVFALDVFKKIMHEYIDRKCR